jgi:hypothetical protein
MSINSFDVDGASKECAASESFRTNGDHNRHTRQFTPEQTLEVAVGREHDAFKTSQFGRPRKLQTKIYEPRWREIWH